MKITKIIHQTWKDGNVPHDRFPKAWIDSWLLHHPGWEYRLWTDAENRNLVAKHYPDFLYMYDSFPKPIERADFARYCILHRHGGLYADLDCIAVKPFDDALDDVNLMFGVEPRTNWWWTEMAFVNGQLSKPQAFLSNALMYSIPRHDFWTDVMAEVRNPRYLHCDDPVSKTGPLLVTRAHDRRRHSAEYMGDDMFPWNRIKGETDPAKMKFVDNVKITENTRCIHVNLTTWDVKK